MKLLITLLFLLTISLPSFSQEKDTITTDSGLKYFYSQKGEGEKSISGWVMITEYIGSFTDGKVFDSSRDREGQFVFVLNEKQVIKGMDEAVSLMRVGDRATFILPSDIAYGEKGAGDVIPPNSTLIFDVELIDMKENSLSKVLMAALRNSEDPSDTTLQIEAMFKVLEEQESNSFEGLYRSESDLNMVGYTIMDTDLAAAIRVFKLNIELYPESANPYDSMGEAYMLAGEDELAIKNYAISIQLDPNNTNATKMIGKMQETRLEETEVVDEEEEVMATLDNFLRAFENGDFETMEALMTNDAYIFPRAIMSNEITEPIDNANYKRIYGLDPQMKMVINSISESGKEPPFMSLEPKDLKITMLNEAAIVTFHLEKGKSLSRRTIVLAKNNDRWQIIHIHPSNVVSLK